MWIEESMKFKLACGTCATQIGAQTLAKNNPCQAAAGAMAARATNGLQNKAAAQYAAALLNSRTVSGAD
ncbi:MAG: hypothetical protein WAM55_08600 [Methylovirgula sp.]